MWMIPVLRIQPKKREKDHIKKMKAFKSFIESTIKICGIDIQNQMRDIVLNQAPPGNVYSHYDLSCLPNLENEQTAMGDSRVMINVSFY